ncbi:MAG: DUF1707 and DUF2154 domain-containing protein [Pseudonocardia sp.]|uniref:DUF1707 SHOCT-like domain-containing protein n=1 Tax=unclassified Pseudonocardia TaxID=2619320 RepID=UPI00086DE598|nr:MULTISPECIES: DUF1707 domain-containing protein [unclassified Pseudonocardia]MBN9113399.1 DUF1707 and DUF2154 domain-containing protein [Pseudonocardia sp.]ODU21152.1 MAG: hypothetical protein ABS80_17775 [Pseudonocardia sp. SCN 72-51]ODV03724.1 MAG: hypothetical protein ABT15_22100 [Pseudonocardia sp. SCN 73-27]
MGDEVAPRDLRVSHAEREHVSRLLAAHLEAGRLSPDEYETRSAAAVAVTRADLNQLLLDLPGAEAVRSREILEWTSNHGDLERSGEWLVPSRIVVRSHFGDVKLDLRDARFMTPVVTLDVDMWVGDVDLRLPPGGTVDVDEVRVHVGHVTNTITPAVHRGDPHVVVRGRLYVGDVKTR